MRGLVNPAKGSLRICVRPKTSVQHSKSWLLHRAYATTNAGADAPVQTTVDSAEPSTTTSTSSDSTPAAEATKETVTRTRSPTSAASTRGRTGRRRILYPQAAAPPDAPLPQYFPSMGFPNLMTPDPLMDAADSITFTPEKGSRLRYPATVTVRNDPSMFDIQREAERQRRIAAGEPEVNERQKAEKDMEAVLEEGISPGPMLRRFAQQTKIAEHAYVLLLRRVVQQTPKGRRPRFSALYVVGNGKGLVGYGEGKDEDQIRARELAYLDAVRNMDKVERFEQRTFFTELRTKLGATQVILRPRPVGFGLRTNPYIHQILKAAGIKDASAKVWGSRNPLNVIKATFRMIWAGHMPVGMGDGVGGGGRKLEKGLGVRTKTEMERERGRRLVDLRT